MEVYKRKLSVDYKISLHSSKFFGYQSKSKEKGNIKLFVSKIYDKSYSFQDFVDLINFTLIAERYCLERAFNKIKIKGGMCNPCCVNKIAVETCKYLFDFTF